MPDEAFISLYVMLGWLDDEEVSLSQSFIVEPTTTPVIVEPVCLLVNGWQLL